MNILLTGATGFIGSHLVRALTARGHKVTACVRHASPTELPRDVTVLKCDFTVAHRPEHWLASLSGMDAVINAVGILRETGDQTFDALHRRAPIALFQACAQAGVKRVVQISALGADEHATSRYHLSKRAADDALIALLPDGIVLRPSLVYGPGGGSDTLFKAMASLPLIPVVGDGRQPIRPVHIDDLMKAVVAAVEHTTVDNRRIDVVGADEIAFADYLARLRNWLGLGRSRFLRVPYPIALLGAKLAGLLGNAPIDAEAISMLRRGNTAPVQPLTEILGVRPGHIAEHLASRPALPADRWHARLFFLRLPLRLSIALVWIWTALTSAWLYPREFSYDLLTQVGITGVAAPFALYGASLLDFALGIATAAGWRLRATGLLQIGVILAYTTVITLRLPEQWLHPFGPIAKNLPLIAATLIMIAMEEKRK